MSDHSSPERRIPLRLLAYWEKLRKGRPMPGENDVNPDDIRDLWDSCFLIHVKDVKPPHYHYSYLGQEIAPAYGDGRPNAGIVDGYMAVVQTGKPLIEGGEFSNQDNQTVKYRQCLLPLGKGDKVQAIFGAIHIRIFPAN